jgi:hypothetical protein
MRFCTKCNKYVDRYHDLYHRGHQLLTVGFVVLALWGCSYEPQVSDTPIEDRCFELKLKATTVGDLPSYCRDNYDLGR